MVLKSRNRQMVRCPLHEDRTPSCSVRLDEDLWNCHSCGKGGSSWDLLMEKEGVNFVGARALAAKFGLTTDGPGPGGEPVSGGSYFGRRGLPPVTGGKPGGGGYKPSWRRR
ncbi:CHC2 zinc finger domain-containing protein [Micromonospora sp. NBC_01813]|uniref:CHC2 zinc finger domain-containing protein n=1 Tax=Micromonospora sp. NBC_01813 TaxID=2975988 RepID=UPI003FA3D856